MRASIASKRMTTTDLTYIFSGFSAAVFVAMAIYIVWRYVQSIRRQPNLTKDEIIFEERFASGCSQKNLLTTMGGARNCLRLIITKQYLWVTSWFPFSLLAPFYDLEHLIPLRSIQSVRPDRFHGSQTFLLTFTTADGRSHCLRLAPRNPEKFAQSLALPVDATPLASQR
jgi:hypothetical protein